MDENHQDKTESKLSTIEYQEKIRHIHKRSFAERMGFAGKTPWDFIQLLLIPLVLAGVGYWFSAQQNQTSLQVSERQHQADLQNAATRYANDQQLAADQQRETTLQTYLDNMSDLLLKQNLAKSKPGDEVRQVARQRTLTTLRRLDAKRNGIVLQFLQDAHLIGVQNAIIDLSKADLSYDDLSSANLRGANLSDADLFGANLSYAWMGQANLSHAWMGQANLRGADLRDANLYGAFLFGADLHSARLRGAHLDKTILKGARYNTKEIVVKDPQGKSVKYPPTQWPQGFDPKAAGATEANTSP